MYLAIWRELECASRSGGHTAERLFACSVIFHVTMAVSALDAQQQSSLSAAKHGQLMPDRHSSAPRVVLCVGAKLRHG